MIQKILRQRANGFFFIKKNIIFALALSMVPLIWARKFYLGAYL